MLDEKGLVMKQRVVNGLYVFAIALVASTMVSAGQMYWNKSHQKDVIVVDTAAIMLAKQKWFTDELMKPGLTDKDKMRVMEQTQQFVKDLDKSLTQMQADCQCVIFDKGAVLIGNYIDKTDGLKKELHL